MTSSRPLLAFTVAAWLAATATPGCSSGGSDGEGVAGAGGSSSTGLAGAGGGAAGGGGPAGSGGAGVAGTGVAGSSAGRGGATGLAGTGVAGTGAAGAAAGSSGGGPAGSGGAGVAGSGSGGRGGGPAGSGGSAAGSTGAAGSGAAGSGGAPVQHGAAAKFVCPQGQTFGNPMTGMGTIMQIAEQSPDYFAFLEGPIWIGSLKTVFFSDNVSQEKIWKVVPPATTATKFLTNSGSNGMAIDNNDKLIVADQAMKRIVRLDPMTAQVMGTPISTGSAKPNDVLTRSDGNIYFTDPDSGFYRISPTGTVSAAMKQVGRPNGIELSPDENTLYVGDVNNKTITKFTVAADGAIDTASAAPFVAATKSGTVDGMCVDCAGNVYAGTDNGVEIYTSAGSYVGTVPTGYASNCTFGGADRKTLYVTSQKVLKYVTLNVPGMPN